METVRFGRSDLSVSRLCLGTMTFAREADVETSFALSDYFVERGGTFIDTANMYADGNAEVVLGRWMKERKNRDEIILATKVYGPMGTGYADGWDGPRADEGVPRDLGARYPGDNNRGLSRFHIMREVEASLRRLQTDVIDLYQIHRWDFTVPPEETVRALDDLVRQGKCSPSEEVSPTCLN